MYSQEFINIQGKERKAREIEIYRLQVRDGERVKNWEEDGKNINTVSGRLNLYICVSVWERETDRQWHIFRQVPVPVLSSYWFQDMLFALGYTMVMHIDAS